MSYAHSDDDDGRLTAFRKQLSAQTRKVIGEEFPIFQDHEDIKWGEEWEARIDESLARVTFFIPIITPSFFKSKYCRDELTRFLEREERLGLKLVLPVYYIETPMIKDESKRSTDELAKTIASRQYADCRDILFEDMDSQKIRQLIYDLATQIRDVLERLSIKATDSAVKAPPKPKVTQHLENLTIPPHRDIVVDQMQHGDYATISEAIKAANPGDKILVRPGIYQEGLVIDKPLEIAGEGERNKIVVQTSKTNVLFFKTNNGGATNLTLRQKGGPNFFAVDVAQGRLMLEDCDISSQGRCCVGIRNGADPCLRGNKIHDGKECGIFVFDNGKGTLEENEIFGNVSSGVAIANGNPTLRKNRIYDGKDVGVFILDGEGMLEENEIFGNAKAGVMINKGISKCGKPTIRRNRINRNGHEGIAIEGGGGVIENNDLRNNKRGAWFISDDSKSKVKLSGNLE